MSSAEDELGYNPLPPPTAAVLNTPAQNPGYQASPCVIKVVGVGGGGTPNRMVETNILGVEFWSVNTDSQALTKALSRNTLNIGSDSTRGLARAATRPWGRAAQESRDEIANICRGADLVFVTAGMGGGTGSGAAPVVAEVAKDPR